MQTLSEVNQRPWRLEVHELNSLKHLSLKIFFFHFMIRVAVFEKSELSALGTSGQN